MGERDKAMGYKDYISDRNQMIYDMRVVKGQTLGVIGKELGVSRERIRQIVAKVERCKRHKERRDDAPPGSLGSMRLTTRLEGRLWHELGEYESIDLLEFFSRVSCREMFLWPELGKKSMNEFAEEAIRIVGKDAVMRWLGTGG
jgi:hypothetical protein